jgi:hypothetical protein
MGIRMRIMREGTEGCMDGSLKGGLAGGRSGEEKD